MRLIAVVCAVLFTVVVPARPAAADATVRGTLQWIAAETPGAADRAVVSAGDRRVPVPAAAVAGVPAGSQVEVRAPETGEGVRAAGTGVRVIAAASEHDLTGTHQLVVLPVYWRTATLPPGSPTAAQLTASVQRVDEYFDAVSDGRIRVAVDRVAPWRKITVGASAGDSCPAHAVEEAARAGAGTLPAGVRRHVVVYFPADSGCEWAGLATLGPSQYTDTTVWLNGDSSLQVFAHEIGHNLGLQHANGAYCYADTAKTTSVPYGDVCESALYDDLWDVMGNRSAGHLAAAHLDELGLLPAAANSVVTGSGQVRLTPLTSGDGLRQLTIPLGDRTVFVEYRTAAGLDAWIDDETNHLDEPTPGGGVLVRYRDDGWPFFRQDEIDVVDFSADSPDSYLRGLQAGQSWLAADGSLGFEVLSADATGATVNVTVAPDTTAPEPFTVTSPERNAASAHDEVTVAWDATTDTGTGVSGYRVELDGVLRATADADTGEHELPGVQDGLHTVRVVAFDRSGNVRAADPVPFRVDTVAPAVTGPRPVLRRGTVSPSALPVTLTWTTSDAGGLSAQTLTHYGVSSTRAATATRTVPANARIGRTNAWIITATDRAGNERQATGPVVRPAVDAPTTGHRGRWSTVRNSRYLGGSERVTTRRGAAVEHTVTARSVGLIATTGRDRSWADVYVDGRRAASVNLYRSATATRQQVWTYSWPSPGRHRITVVNRATPGRPLLGVDGFARLS